MTQSSRSCANGPSSFGSSWASSAFISSPTRSARGHQGPPSAGGARGSPWELATDKQDRGQSFLSRLGGDGWTHSIPTQSVTLT